MLARRSADLDEFKEKLKKLHAKVCSSGNCIHLETYINNFEKYRKNGLKKHSIKLSIHNIQRIIWIHNFLSSLSIYIIHIDYSIIIGFTLVVKLHMPFPLLPHKLLHEFFDTLHYKSGIYYHANHNSSGIYTLHSLMFHRAKNCTLYNGCHYTFNSLQFRKHLPWVYNEANSWYSSHDYI